VVVPGVVVGLQMVGSVERVERVERVVGVSNLLLAET
jgi:hypothetical protein